ncbi:GNAT family N-acetyltransferase [Promicromonospora kroppenstedtii]|uniref:GNAT family N-acetyltransferase n=1 Tax=Promicromonospora kroppenstedtii TaxID=440482 RepID=UPI0009FBED80|nr:GNAT family N-acetyltransferase [Promicromonospora kroppenstedtii]
MSAPSDATAGSRPDAASDARARPVTGVREASAEDWPAIWPIVEEVVRAADTFAYDPAMGEADARAGWLEMPRRVVVAVRDGVVVGTANMYANRPGPGSHVASGSIMVDRAVRGSGAGRALVRDMIAWAAREGFAAIQFNAVVDTNAAAVHLYESLGFVTLGVAPGAFRHPELGDVGLRIMWRDLSDLPDAATGGEG